MGQVIKFISRKEFVKTCAERDKVLGCSSSVKEPIVNKVSAKSWLQDAYLKLSEDDYLDVLESIISPEIYREHDKIIQTFVDGFFTQRNVGQV